VTVAGLRTKTLSFNSGMVDISNSDSPNKWRQLLAGAEIKSVSLSGDGIFSEAASAEKLRGHFFGGTIPRFQVIVPGFGTIVGLFQITKLDFGGEYNKETTLSISLESAGEMSFTAA
jgi:TP901-1 family phage major tail protein